MNKSKGTQIAPTSRETAASEVLSLTAHVADMAERVANELCVKLKPVMRSVNPIGKDPVKDKGYPRLFKDWATYVHSIRNSLVAIERAIRQVDL